MRGWIREHSIGPAIEQCIFSRGVGTQLLHELTNHADSCRVKVDTDGELFDACANPPMIVRQSLRLLGLGARKVRKQCLFLGFEVRGQPLLEVCVRRRSNFAIVRLVGRDQLIEQDVEVLVIHDET